MNESRNDTDAGRRHYAIPCPACGTMQPTPDDLEVHEADDLQRTVQTCAHCGRDILRGEMPPLLKAGRWLEPGEAAAPELGPGWTRDAVGHARWRRNDAGELQLHVEKPTNRAGRISTAYWAATAEPLGTGDTLASILLDRLRLVALLIEPLLEHETITEAGPGKPIADLLAETLQEVPAADLEAGRHYWALHAACTEPGVIWLEGPGWALEIGNDAPLELSEEFLAAHRFYGPLLFPHAVQLRAELAHQLAEYTAGRAPLPKGSDEGGRNHEAL